METLIRDADAAMYSAKSLGRNQTYIFAEPDDDNRVPRAPISAAGRARALEVGQQARDAATTALTSVLLPLPHYRGQPSPVIATIVVSMARQLQLPDADIDRAAGRRAPARRRQGRRAEGDPREADRADLGRVADRGPASAHRPGHPGAGRGAQGRRADHPAPPRALRRPRLPVRPARQRDPARGADRGRRRRLRRDDHRPTRTSARCRTWRRSPSCAATRARSSTPSSSSPSATCTATRRRRPIRPCWR